MQRPCSPLKLLLACLVALSAFSLIPGAVPATMRANASSSAAPKDVQDVLRRLQDADAFVRLMALRDAAELGEAALPLLPHIEKMTADPDPDVQALARVVAASIQELGLGVDLRFTALDEGKPAYCEWVEIDLDQFVVLGAKDTMRQKHTTLLRWTPRKGSPDRIVAQLELLAIKMSTSSNQQPSVVLDSDDPGPTSDYVRFLVEHGRLVLVLQRTTLEVVEIQGRDELLDKLGQRSPQWRKLAEALLSNANLGGHWSHSWNGLPNKRVRRGETWQARHVSSQALGLFTASNTFSYAGLQAQKHRIALRTKVAVTAPAPGQPALELPFAIAWERSKMASVDEGEFGTGMITFDPTKGRNESVKIKVKMLGQLTVELPSVGGGQDGVGANRGHDGTDAGHPHGSTGAGVHSPSQRCAARVEKEESTMNRKWTLVVAFLCLVPAGRGGSQTMPPEKPAPEPDYRKVLGKEESLTRLSRARDLFWQGQLVPASDLLRGLDVTIDWTVAAAPGELEVARGIVALKQGDLRAAYVAARAAFQSAREKKLQLEASLLQSLIFARARVWPISQFWADLARVQDAECRALKYLEEMMRGEKVGSYTKATAQPHPRDASFVLEVYRCKTPAPQRAVLVIRRGAEFHGALAVEAVPVSDRALVYALTFYDLEGAPVQVTDYVAAEPTDAALLAFVADLDPRFGTGRFTIMRAEVEALTSYRLGITPLAAHWAAYAGTRLTDDNVKRKLQEALAWTWAFRGRDSGGPLAGPRHLMLGYVNEDAPSGIRDRFPPTGPIEHYHFAVFTHDTRLYLGSYVVASDEPGPGERLYFLKRLVRGQTHVLDVFPDLPTYEAARAKILEYLNVPPHATP